MARTATDNDKELAVKISSLKNENESLRAQLQREVAETRRLQGQLQIERTTKDVLQAEVDKYYHHLGFECLGSRAADQHTSTNVVDPSSSHGPLRAAAISASVLQTGCDLETRKEDKPSMNTAERGPSIKLEESESSVPSASRTKKKKTVVSSPPAQVKEESEYPVIDLVSDCSDDDGSIKPEATESNCKDELSQPLCSLSLSEKVPEGIPAENPQPLLPIGPSSQQELPRQVGDTPLRTEQVVEACASLGTALPIESGQMAYEPEPRGRLEQQEQDQTEEELEYFTNPEDQGQAEPIAENMDRGSSTLSEGRPDGVDPVKEPIPTKGKEMQQSNNPRLERFPSDALRGIFHSRLERIGLDPFPITAGANIVDRYVSPSRLRKMCGGDKGSLLRAKFAEAELKGYTRVFFPFLETNPFLPRVPGAPGLFLAAGLTENVVFAEVPREKEFLAVKYNAKDCNVMGEYELRPSDPLTPEEFRLLPAECKQANIDEIKNTEKGRSALTGIFLYRTLGRMPSSQEINAAMPGKTNRKSSVRLSDAELEATFVGGILKVYVWTMKCVGYSEALKRRLSAYKPHKTHKNNAPTDNTTLDQFFITANLQAQAHKKKVALPVAKPDRSTSTFRRVECGQDKLEAVVRTTTALTSQVSATIPLPSNNSKRQKRALSDDDSYKESDSDADSSDDDIYKGLRRRRRRR